jgi:hypothetical protein
MVNRCDHQSMGTPAATLELAGDNRRLCLQTLYKPTTRMRTSLTLTQNGKTVNNEKNFLRNLHVVDVLL